MSSSKKKSSSSQKKRNCGSTFVFPWKIILVSVVFVMFLLLILYFSPLISLALVPFILLILLVLRLLQFITYRGDTYKNVTQFKHFVRICLFTALLTFQCSIHFKPVSYEHQDRFPFDLNKLTLHQSKKSLILIRYVISFMAYFVIHHFGTKQSFDGSNLHVMQALSEIIDCIILFWEDNIMSTKTGCYSPNILLDDKPIEVKYVLAALLKYSTLLKILAPVLVYYDLIILVIELVRYVLRNLVSLYMKYFPCPRQRTTSKIEVIYTLIAKRSFSFFFTFMLIRKVCSDCLVSFFAYKFDQAKSLQEYDTIEERFEQLIELADPIYKFLLAFFILWIIKSYALLAWESHTIYDRLRSRIISVSKQLYFLGILDRRDQNIFSLQEYRQTKDDGSKAQVTSSTERFMQIMIQMFNVLVDIVLTSSLKSLPGFKGNDEWRNIKRNKIKVDLLWDECRDAGLYDIQQMAQYIVGAKSNLPDNYISTVVTHVDPEGKNSYDIRTLKQLITWNNDYKEDGDYFVDDLLKINDDAESGNTWTVYNLFRSQYPNQSKPKDKPSIVFRKWVVKTHDNVKSLANTLTSAKEVIEGLNKLVSAFLIGATFMAWLKAVKYAETSQDFALIASPFLATTFLIKDTLKDLFERIFFVYIIHPFDIGDILRFDNNMMEVAAIGLWTTTLLAMDKDGKRERREAIIYPNSMLAKIKITKHKMEFDFGDNVENEQASSSNGKLKKNN